MYHYHYQSINLGVDNNYVTCVSPPGLDFQTKNCVSTLVLATGLIVLRKNRLYNTISDLSLKLYDISLQTNKLDQNKDSQQGADYSSRGE